MSISVLCLKCAILLPLATSIVQMPLSEQRFDPVVVATRNEQIVVAFQAPASVYAENNLLQLSRAIPQWEESFRHNPEFVALYWSVYNLQRDHRRRVSLAMNPEAWLSRVPDSVLQLGLHPESDSRLREASLVCRTKAAPYDMFFFQSATSENSRPLMLIVATHAANDGHRVVRFDGGSIFSWIMACFPELDVRKKSRFIASGLPKNLDAFLITVQPDSGNDPIVQFRVTYDKDAATPPQSTAISLYCLIECNAEDSDIAFVKRTNRPGATAAQNELRTQLALSWVANSVEDQKRLFLTKYFAQLENNHRRILASPMKPGPGAYQGVPVLTRGLLDQSARLLATIDGGVGYVHFFWNPPDARLSPGKVVHVVVQEEGGVPKLGDSFIGEEAEVSEIFATEEFKAGLIEYLKAKHVDVLKKAGYPLP